jgi:Cu/Ag efflux protein CusF
LAISNTGIAFCQGGKHSQLLTDATFRWKDANQLAEILFYNKNIFKNKQVNVVLSNTFVRYLILPWQEEVLTQTEWQAIAQHAFRKAFGAIANDWLTRVHFAQYGQTVLVAAIDNSLYTQLQHSAAQIGFDLVALEPLLTCIFNQDNNNIWTLIAEPQRLMLCQIRNGEWMQIAVDSPPAGQEYQKGEQLIQRSFLQLDTVNQPSKITTYVSAALSQGWQDKIGSRQKLMTPFTGVQAHALWMANLPVSNKRAQNLQLDFASKVQASTQFVDLILLVTALTLAVFLWVSYQQTQLKINTLQQQYAANQNINSTVKPDPVTEEKLMLAHQTLQQLNLPWMPMLTALEMVKKANPNIALLNISPNKNRAEIKLIGEATDFADITRLLNGLRINEAFNDAVLVSQHLEQEDTKNGQKKLIYVFEMNVGWRI